MNHGFELREVRHLHVMENILGNPESLRPAKGRTEGGEGRGHQPDHGDNCKGGYTDRENYLNESESRRRQETPL
jgi:hypothetical protein